MGLFCNLDLHELVGAYLFLEKMTVNKNAFLYDNHTVLKP